MKVPSSAAVYARISSDQDGSGLGVTRQLEDCRKLAAELGWQIGEEYVDNDVSAFTGKRRPAYVRMLADLRDGFRDAVIVYHVDRLTRRPIELEQFVETVTAAGVSQVQFVAGTGVDFANGDGLLVLRMLGAVAASESATKSRRIRRKMEQVAAEGRPHGGSNRPFGFEDDRVTHRPDEVEVIRQLVARYLAGEGLLSLTRWLDDSGVKTVRGGVWRMTSIQTLMMNPRIAGLRAHNGTIVGPAVWEPIISEDDHRRVLARMAQRKMTGRRTPRNYLLTGMCRCGKCGGRLFSSRRENSRRYVCLSGPDHGGGCGRLTVVAEPLETLIADAVLYRLDTPELADMLAGRASADEQTAALADSLAADNAQLEELASMYAAKQITAREWMTARQAIEARVQDLTVRLARLTRSDALVGLVGNGTQLRGQWSTLNLGRQHAIVRGLIDRIVIAPIGNVGGRGFDPSRVHVDWRI